jgi:hypothetical protein
VQMPKDTVDDRPVILPRMARGAGIARGEERREQLPLRVGQFVAMHGSSSLIHIPIGKIGIQWYSRAEP